MFITHMMNLNANDGGVWQRSLSLVSFAYSSSDDSSEPSELSFVGLSVTCVCPVQNNNTVSPSETLLQHHERPEWMQHLFWFSSSDFLLTPRRQRRTSPAVLSAFWSLVGVSLSYLRLRHLNCCSINLKQKLLLSKKSAASEILNNRNIRTVKHHIH